MGSTTSKPLNEYWHSLIGEWEASQVEELKLQSDRGRNEFNVNNLPPPQNLAAKLLKRFESDGWVSKRIRRSCQNCSYELDVDSLHLENCPECEESISESGGVKEETYFVRDLQLKRSVDWVIAVHGMNTTGEWQQEFNWLVGRTWGKSVPIAVYKYGIVRVGVLLPWRRRQMQNQLREKLVKQSLQAKASGYSGKPDVIAHSFGTWLIGHLLKKELSLRPENQMKFGRIILTGCILRPDFDWKTLKEAGLVEEVLNHYGNKDRIVPLAQLTIWDSGPSGRIGFNCEDVTNVCAKKYGHSDLFSIKKCVISNEHFQDCSGCTHENTHLFHSYDSYWKPFLIQPESELGLLVNHRAKPKKWKQLPWVLRGTLFPMFFLPFLLALLLLFSIWIGVFLSGWSLTLHQAVIVSGFGLLFLGVVGGINWVYRLIRNQVS